MNLIAWIPTVVALIAAVGAWVSATYQQRASNHHTDSELLRGFNQQLQERLNQVENRLGTVSSMTQQVRTQVTNGGTNLAETVGKTNGLLGALGEDVRVMRSDLSGLGNDVRRLREDLTKLEHRDSGR